MIKDNLQRFRALRGFTQSALAEAAGISRNAYRKIETGESDPRMETLRELATALNADVEDLLQSTKSLDQVRFRALKSSTATKQKRAQRETLIHSCAAWLDRYNELEQRLDKGLRCPDWMGQTYDSPEDAARIIREKLKICNTCAVFQLCDILQDSVKFWHFTTEDVARNPVFGFCIGPADDGPVVAVNVTPSISVERVIFTTAHELGHLVLHLNNFDNGNRDVEDDQEEKEANQFASEFLMPASLFRRAWQQTGGLDLFRRVMKMKQSFFVSYQAVLYRAVNLGLADRNIWPAFNAILKARGDKRTRIEEIMPHEDDVYAASNWRRSREAHALDEAVLLESRLDGLVREAMEQHVINLREAAELLEISTEDMRERRDTWAFDRRDVPSKKESVWDTVEEGRKRFGPLTESIELPERSESARDLSCLEELGA